MKKTNLQITLWPKKGLKAKGKKKKKLEIDYIFTSFISWFQCKYCKRMNILCSPEGKKALKKQRSQWIKVDFGIKLPKKKK